MTHCATWVIPGRALALGSHPCRPTLHQRLYSLGVRTAVVVVHIRSYLASLS